MIRLVPGFLYGAIRTATASPEFAQRTAVLEGKVMEIVFDSFSTRSIRAAIARGLRLDYDLVPPRFLSRRFQLSGDVHQPSERAGAGARRRRTHRSCLSQRLQVSENDNGANSSFVGRRNWVIATARPQTGDELARWPRVPQ